MNDTDFKAKVIADALAAGMTRATAELLAKKASEPFKMPEGQHHGIRASAAADDHAHILADVRAVGLPDHLAPMFVAAGFSHKTARAALRDACALPAASMAAYGARLGLQLVSARLKGQNHATR